MIITKDTFEQMINSPIRTLRGRVEIYKGSTLALICGCHDRLIDFKIERIGEQGKLFGFGICQKLTTNLLDRNRELNITKDNSLEVEFGVGSDYLYPCPNFFVDDVKRDENNNNLTVTAYDALYAASAHTVSELELTNSYTIGQFAKACASLLGLPMKEVTLEPFNIVYEDGANFDGTETIREALNAVAEATQTIYYIDSNWELTFKRLDTIGEPVAIIDKTKYFTLDTQEEASKVTTITHSTELGDDVTASIGDDGMAQYVRNNPFWELRDDLDILVEDALNAIKDIVINQFNCDWRGNYLLEIGDKIGITNKTDDTVISYLLDDTIEFNGALSGKTSWKYTENKAETSNNPTNLGEMLKQTYARVDKQKKEIELLASEAATNKSNIASLQVTTDGLLGRVTEISTQTKDALDGISDNIETLTKKVEAQVTADQVSVQIRSELDNGVTKVSTSTGYTLDEEGLTVEKTNREMKTQITEDGMQVFKNNSPVLTANNVGVDAANLHATTYLIVGENSRFEDYDGGRRTGCFWIGG